MSMARKATIGIGVGLGVVALAVIGSAMFLAESGEEMMHLYKDYKASQRQAAAAPWQDSGAMELQGRWHGMSLTAANSPTAAAFGLREVEGGVVVAEAPVNGSPAASSGVMPGDLVVGVDNQRVGDMADLYNASRAVDPTRPVLLDVRRQGRPVTLVLPAMATRPAVAGGGEPPERTVNPVVPAAWGPRHLYCPRDGTMIPAAGLAGPNGVPGPTLLCPRCRGPLSMLQAMPR
jgi:hypothetical protein